MGSTTLISVDGLRLRFETGAGGTDISKDDVIVVPYRGRSFGRQVGSAIRAYGRDEAEPLLADHALHVFGQDSHCNLEERRSDLGRMLVEANHGSSRIPHTPLRQVGRKLHSALVAVQKSEA